MKILVARNPEAAAGCRSTVCARFDDDAEAADWIARASTAGRNLYIVRNPIIDGVLYRHNAAGDRVPSGRWGNPPTLEDIAAIRFLPIDVDPRPSVDVDKAGAHAEELLHALRELVPLRFIMHSGRGRQAQVELADPPGRGDTERWVAAMSLAHRIEEWLAAQADASLVVIDRISNVNRFTRLEGTVNRRTGRRAAVVEDYGSGATVAYPTAHLSGIALARARCMYVPVERIADGLSSNRHIQDALRELGHVPGKVVREMLAELEAAAAGHRGPGRLSRDMRHWATSGENFMGMIDEDRSNRQHHFACEGIRRGEPIHELYRALTDKSNAVLNEHVIAKRKDAVREALRNLTKAIISEYGVDDHEAYERAFGGDPTEDQVQVPVTK